MQLKLKIKWPKTIKSRRKNRNQFLKCLHFEPLPACMCNKLQFYDSITSPHQLYSIYTDSDDDDGEKGKGN